MRAIRSSAYRQPPANFDGGLITGSYMLSMENLFPGRIQGNIPSAKQGEKMNKNGILTAAGLLLLCSGPAVAQEQSGILQGQVLGPLDEAVPNAPIQATHKDSGANWRTRSAADGRYEFTGLPAGAYQVKAVMPCCRYEDYVNDAVGVSAQSDTSFTINLEEGTSFNTIGDDFGAITADILREQVVPDLPLPRMPDGKPDLSGMWIYGSDPFPTEPEPTQWAEQTRADDKERGVINPRFRCLPPSIPIPSHSPPQMGKFLQTADFMAILYEGILGYRQIFLDGREHHENVNPSWLGYSIGHWEGDVLVVETMGFNDRGWTSGYPRTERMRVVERYQRTEYGVMELQYTIEDPDVFQKPIVRQLRLDLAPGEELLEYVCENNVWIE